MEKVKNERIRGSTKTGKQWSILIGISTIGNNRYKHYIFNTIYQTRKLVFKKKKNNRFFEIVIYSANR